MALDRYGLAGRIRELLDPELAAAGFELLDVRIFRGGGRLQVRVYVDTEGGIDLSGCAHASRTIDPVLEESGLVEDQYVIEVSSPGVRRPLRKAEHFQRYLGETVEIRAGVEGAVWRVRGVLTAADDYGVTVRPVADRPRPAAVPDEEAGEDEALAAAKAAEEADAAEAAEAAEAAGDDDEDEAPEAMRDLAPAAAGDEAATRTVPHMDILEADLDPDFDPQALIQADRRRRKLERRQERQERRERPRRRPRKQGPAGDA